MRSCPRCGGTLEGRPDDPLLPDFIKLFECSGCDEWYELDQDTMRLEKA